MQIQASWFLLCQNASPAQALQQSHLPGHGLSRIASVEVIANGVPENQDAPKYHWCRSNVL